MRATPWRWLPAVAAALVLLASACLLLRRPAPAPRVDPEGYAAVRLGMTAEEAERALGAPPGDYGAGRVLEEGEAEEEEEAPEGPAGELLQWVGDRYAVQVVLDRVGRVGWKRLTPITRGRPPLWERLRGWLGGD